MRLHALGITTALAMVAGMVIVSTQPASPTVDGLVSAAKVAEERGWKASIEEMTIKTQALKDAGIKVLKPTPELKAGLSKIGETIAVEWEKAAGADGKAMLSAYRK